MFSLDNSKYGQKNFLTTEDPSESTQVFLVMQIILNILNIYNYLEYTASNEKLRQCILLLY